MRYYDKQPLIGYLLVPLIFPPIRVLLLWIVVCVLSGIFTDHTPLLTRLITGLLVYAFFVGWYIYSYGHKDCIELSPGNIQLIYDKRRKKLPILIKTSEIDLFEIISDYHPLAQKYYRVYASVIDFPGPDKFLQFDSLLVPEDDVLKFCAENGITPRQKKMKLPNYDSVKLRKQDIVIKYDTRWWFKKIRIPIGDISSIELVHPHLISVTEDYYQVTAQENCHQFWHYIIEREKLEQYCKKHNLPFSEKTLS